MKTLITLLASIILCVGCISKSDPTPSTSSNHGSWTYGGNTFNGTSSSWAATTLVSLASKPHTSGLEASFSSANPSAGDYSIATDGDISANEVDISVVDSDLPAITYTSIDSDAGTVSVSRSGGSITVTVTNVKLKGFKSDAKLDSIVVSGTIIK